ncbi:MAG: DUF5320 domain-containing protein [Bacteroidales bacterium]|nr:DUF5320 domain-containing protein [Bacteroidales bacterium]
MPNNDKTGPEGKGAKTGRGLGNCDDSNNSNRGFFGRGRGRGNGNGQGNGRGFGQGNNSKNGRRRGWRFFGGKNND